MCIWQDDVAERNQQVSMMGRFLQERRKRYHLVGRCKRTRVADNEVTRCPCFFLAGL